MAALSSNARPRAVQLECLDCPTRALAEWSALSDQDMTQLSRAKSSRRYGKGEFIYVQGEACSGVYCLAQGTAAIRRAALPLPPILVRLAFAGETLGYRNLLGGVCTTSAKTLEPCLICHIEPAVLSRFLRRSVRLSRGFQHHLAEDLDTAEAAMLSVAWLPVRARLASLLLYLLERIGPEQSAIGAGEFLLPMTRRDMAELLCTRPETLTRTVQSLEADRVVRVAGNRVTVPSTRRLREEAVPEAGAATSSGGRTARWA